MVKIFRLLIFAALIVLFLTPAIAQPQPTFADGVIIPEPPICRRCPIPPPPPHEVPYLTVQSHHVDVTIDRQVATTRVDQIFRNDSDWSLEGTYIFPLPEEAAIGEFAMWIDGQKVEGQLYTKEEARRIYDEIVRRRLDPALLEYIGRDLFQASIFPIDPGDTRRIVIEYSQVLSIDNGLVRYVYPLSTEKFSAKPLEDVSVTVEVRSDEAIKAVYSPSHPVSIDRPDDFRALAGWEDRNALPTTDFVLYYTVSPEDLGLNLLSFKDDDEDGFFTMLIAPSIEVDEVIEKDVVLVLDTSGSMEGEKIRQAQDALTYVLEHLNPGDRFNVVAFSTGARSFSSGLESPSDVPEARRFVQDLRAEGSTDINRALLEAIAGLDRRSERPAIIIFLTDGLPTSGTTEADMILNNVAQASNGNIRIFPFGVGDDVDTFLLDSLARQERGVSAYVRPGERVDEAVSAFYAKVSTPVLADVSLDVDGVRIEETYPFPLPDIFAGTQLVVVGRYRQGGPASVTLEGTVNGRSTTFHYDDLTFTREGGQDFIPRLWATRKIGYLLNDIRLNGENPEALDQIVKLSIRYGIITPYTSFLVEEPDDALTQRGREEIVERQVEELRAAPTAPVSGAAAVDQAVASESLERADFAAPPVAEVEEDQDIEVAESGRAIPKTQTVQTVGDKAFVLRDGVWTDTVFDPSRMQTTRFSFASREFLDFLQAHPEAARYFALDQQVIVVLDGTAYETIPIDPDALSAGPQPALVSPANSPDAGQTAASAPTEPASVALSASPVRGSAPLSVTFNGTLVGGPDNNQDFYCVERTFHFGDGVSESAIPGCLAWTPETQVQRDYSAHYTYEQPGTYYAQFSLGDGRQLRSEFVEIVVESPGQNLPPFAPTQGNERAGTGLGLLFAGGIIILVGGLLSYRLLTTK